MFGTYKKAVMPRPEQALQGRASKMPVTNRHFVNGHPLQAPFPEHLALAMFGMGCFGALKNAFGSYPASIAPPLVMQQVIHLTQAIKKFARDKPGIMKWY